VDHLALYEQHKEELGKVLRQHGSAYFSARQQGMPCGLVNQGATCYLNSLLQTLFMTLEFRRAVYSWEYDEDKDGPKEKCIPYQLQALFSRLELSSKAAVSTKALTTSFGWTGGDTFTQHDVQELSTILMDALERASAAFRGITRLWRGSAESFVEPKDISDPTQRHSRLETFNDIQVPIEGCGDLHSALEKVVQPEELVGPNQWFCEELGEKVDARRGVVYKELPQVLTLHLLRFQFDFELQRRRKITDPLAFPRSLNLDFLLGDGPQDPQRSLGPEGEFKHTVSQRTAQYDLFSILVHQGTADRGHYYSYIRDFDCVSNSKGEHQLQSPTCPEAKVDEGFELVGMEDASEWYCFNDASVHRLGEAEESAIFHGGVSSVDAGAVDAGALAIGSAGAGMFSHVGTAPQAGSATTTPPKAPAPKTAQPSELVAATTPPEDVKSSDGDLEVKGDQDLHEETAGTCQMPDPSAADSRSQKDVVELTHTTCSNTYLLVYRRRDPDQSMGSLGASLPLPPVPQALRREIEEENAAWGTLASCYAIHKKMVEFRIYPPSALALTAVASGAQGLEHVVLQVHQSVTFQELTRRAYQKLVEAEVQEGGPYPDWEGGEGNDAGSDAGSEPAVAGKGGNQQPRHHQEQDVRSEDGLWDSRGVTRSQRLDDVSIARCRLRRFAPHLTRAGETFGGSLALPIGVNGDSQHLVPKSQCTLAELGLKGSAVLVMECKRPWEEHVEWTEFNPNEMSLQLVKWDRDDSRPSQRMADTVGVVVPGEKFATVRDAKLVAARAFLEGSVAKQSMMADQDVEAAWLSRLLLAQVSGTDVTVLEDDSKSLRDYGVWPGEQILVEIFTGEQQNTAVADPLPPGEDGHVVVGASAHSDIVATFDAAMNTIEINFNHPDELESCSHSVFIKRGCSMRQLKEAIVDHLNRSIVILAEQPGTAVANTSSIRSSIDSNADSAGTTAASSLPTTTAAPHSSVSSADSLLSYASTIAPPLSTPLASSCSQRGRLGVDTVHLRRGTAKGAMVKDETKSLKAMALVNGSVVWVGHGKPCLPGEFFIDFVRFNPATKPSFVPICTLPIHQDMKIAGVKRKLAQHLSAMASVPPAWSTSSAGPTVSSGDHQTTSSHVACSDPGLIRLRHKKIKEAGAILRDGRSVRKSILNLSDGQQLAVQFLEEPETVSAEDVVILIKGFRPLVSRFTVPVEIVVPKSMALGELRDLLHRRFGDKFLSTSPTGASVVAVEASTDICAEDADSDQLQVAKLPGFGPPLKAAQALSKLKWDDPCYPASIEVGRPPLSLRDGSVLVICSSKDAASATAAASSLTSTSPKRSSTMRRGATQTKVWTAGRTAYKPPKEKALVIGEQHRAGTGEPKTASANSSRDDDPKSPRTQFKEMASVLGVSEDQATIAMEAAAGDLALAKEFLKSEM